MSRVPYKFTAIRTDDDDSGKNVVPYATVNAKDKLGAPANIYTVQTGGTASSSFILDANGEKQIWVEPGIYQFSVAGGAYFSVSVSSSTTEDFTAAEKTKLASIENGATKNRSDTEVQEDLNLKFDKSSVKPDLLAPNNSDSPSTLAVASAIADSMAGETPRGAWNASTNTPALASSVGTAGYWYEVSVAGTTNLNGETGWQVGDKAIFNGTIWTRIPANAVKSVDGRTGAVILNYDTPAQAALASLSVGAKYSTKGAVTVGDGGHGDFIVEAASGTPDGYGRVLLANGNHGVLQLVNGSVNVLQFGAVKGADSTAAIQACIDFVGRNGGGEVSLPTGTLYASHIKMRHANVSIRANGNSSYILSVEDFTSLHPPTIWICADNCTISGVRLGYVGWDDDGYSSFQTARPDGNSWYGAHISVGYTELYTSASSGIYNTFDGELLSVVRGTRIHDVHIHGTALHGVALLNAVDNEITGGSITQFKGTGVYGWIAPQTTVRGVNFESSRDDSVYLGGSDGYMNGVWTPLSSGDLVDIKILNNRSLKCGAKVYSASGYNGVLIDGNWSVYSRASAFYTASEASQGVSASRNVKICNNVMLETFSGYGPASEGYGYTNSIVEAAGGNHYAVDISGCSDVELINNTVVRSVADNSSGFRGLFGGAANPQNVKSSNNKWIGFVRNNCGLEIAATPVASDITFSNDTFTGYAGDNGVRFLHVGVNAENVCINDCSMESSAPSSGSWAAIWLGGGSNVYVKNIETNLTGGLGLYNDSEVSASLFVDGHYDYARSLARPKSIGGSIRWGSSAPSTGAWVLGDEVKNTSPTLARNISHWKCVAAGTPGQWSAYGCGTGTTAQRPLLTSNDLGYLYQDTTDGSLVFWNGSGWV